MSDLVIARPLTPRSPEDVEQPGRAGGGGLPPGLHHGGRPPGGLCLQQADGPSTLNKS